MASLRQEDLVLCTLLSGFFFSALSQTRRISCKTTLLLGPAVLPAFDTVCLSLVLEFWKWFMFNEYVLLVFHFV